MTHDVTEAQGAARARRPFASPALFAVILIAFMLPFVTVSCDEQTVHATGFELATSNVAGANGLACVEETGWFFGGAPDPAPSCNTAQKVENEGTPLALIALLCAIVGLGLSLGRLWLSFVPSATGRARGGLVPLILVALVGGGALGLGMIDAGFSSAEVHLEAGFWIAYLLLIALFWGHVVGLIRLRRLPYVPSGAVQLPPGAIPRL
jgi:hypothetical protein